VGAVDSSARDAVSIAQGLVTAEYARSWVGDAAAAGNVCCLRLGVSGDARRGDRSDGGRVVRWPGWCGRAAGGARFSPGWF